MSALTLFFIIFLGVLMVGGWISSEYISHKNSKQSKRFHKEMLRLEKENEKLQNELISQIDRYTRLKADYDNVKDDI